MSEQWVLAWKSSLGWRFVHSDYPRRKPSIKFTESMDHALAFPSWTEASKFLDAHALRTLSYRPRRKATVIMEMVL